VDLARLDALRERRPVPVRGARRQAAPRRDRREAMALQARLLGLSRNGLALEMGRLKIES
jgi:hypothetical protein